MGQMLHKLDSVSHTLLFLQIKENLNVKCYKIVNIYKLIKDVAYYHEYEKKFNTIRT